MVRLSDTQLERYARHLVLPAVGGVGQQRLLKAAVLLVGAGGLGTPIALYLAAAGVGRITIIDDDRVSLSNLQRQILYRSEDIGRPKVACAAEALRSLNPDPAIAALEERATDETLHRHLPGHDLVIDGCDNFATRLAVNDAAIAAGIPLLSAALGPFDGQIALFDPGHDAHAPCYRCFIGDVPPGQARSCAEDGILGAVAGLVGCWTATEALKELAGIGSNLRGRLLLIDAMMASSRSVAINRDPACPACAVVARPRAALS